MVSVNNTTADYGEENQKTCVHEYVSTSVVKQL